MSTSLSSPARQHRRRAILDAARAIFLRDGYDRASVDAIAELAGVSKQTIYNYGADKDQLFIQVIEEATDACGQAWHAVLAAIPEDRDDPVQELVAVSRALVVKALDPEGLAMKPLLTTEAKSHPNLVDGWLARGEGTIKRLLAERIAAIGARHGLAVPDTDASARHLYGMIVSEAETATAFGARVVDAADLEPALAGIVEFFVRGHTGGARSR